DMQGPADVAGQLFGYDKLFIAVYESPKHFHCLMTAAADAFLLFWRAQRELAGNLFVPTHLFGWDWVPPEAGASLSADSLAMISPAFYDDFYRPHLERLSRELGGLAVHACGNFSAIVPRLCHTAGVKAINAGQMAIRELIAAGADRRVLLIAGAGVEEAPAILRHANEEGWRIDLTVSGHWPVGERGVKPAAAWTQADLDLMRRREEALLAAAHDVACP
ncbi:MAG: hypothetical protein N3A66_05990, partial [Planctomycetota bacterium]|nr:hypothetical protein [Planctomycetota bacterium]